MKSTLEMALKKLAAAHAVVSEAEWFVKKAMAENGYPAPMPQKEANPPSDARDTKPYKDTPQSPKVAQRGENQRTAARQPVPPVKGAVQGELFSPAQFAEQKRKEQSRRRPAPAHRTKGTPKVSRREALANFREIAGSKTLLDLGDVNRIFGFNRTTSGTFVKTAVAQGRLVEVPVGAKRKFVAKDVRRFIAAYFSAA